MKSREHGKILGKEQNTTFNKRSANKTGWGAVDEMPLK